MIYLHTCTPANAADNSGPRAIRKSRRAVANRTADNLIGTGRGKINENQAMIDWTKPIRTKLGRPAEYIGLTKDIAHFTTWANCQEYPRAVRVEGVRCVFTDDGSYITEGPSEMDLENVPDIEEKSVTKKLDYRKPFKTTGGNPARLIGELEGRTDSPFAVAVSIEGVERIVYGDENGQLYIPGFDRVFGQLVNIEPETYVTLVLYRSNNNNNGELYVHVVLYDDPLNDLSVYEVGKEYIGTMRIKLKPDEMGNEP